jgi:endonuclease YncB( thermonuclease family)
MSRRFVASWQFAAGVLATLATMGAAVVIGGNTLPGAEAPGSGTFTCTVTKVHDGDGPIWCAEGPKIRLTAVSARELDGTCSPGHPCPSASGLQAQQALWRLAGGQRLTCQATGSSYKRVTAWCWRPDGVELNCAMLKSGTVARWAKFDPQRRMCR